MRQDNSVGRSSQTHRCHATHAQVCPAKHIHQHPRPNSAPFLFRDFYHEIFRRARLKPETSRRFTINRQIPPTTIPYDPLKRRIRSIDWLVIDMRYVERLPGSKRPARPAQRSNQRRQSPNNQLATSNLQMSRWRARQSPRRPESSRRTESAWCSTSFRGHSHSISAPNGAVRH